MVSSNFLLFPPPPPRGGGGGGMLKEPHCHLKVYLKRNIKCTCLCYMLLFAEKNIHWNIDICIHVLHIISLLVFVSPERMFVETHSDPNSACPCVRPLKFWLTFFKLLLFEQVRFNYNQTWIIGALGKLHIMMHLEVTWQGQRSFSVKLLVISVNLFQIAPVRTGSLQLQPNLVHRCTMETFSLWRSSRSHDKVKGHWRSNCYSYFG